MSDRLTLRDPTAQEYASYRTLVRDAYRDDLVTNGGHDAEEAAEKAARDTRDLLPEDGAPADQVVKIADLDGKLAGYLWVGRGQIGDIAWVQDVVVEPELRGQGFGRQLMAAAEGIAAELGYRRIGLNVMGGNVGAIRLYESLGYTVMHQQMSKDLAPAPTPEQSAPAPEQSARPEG
jgi:ribosomal protein S18 acetylase RimI-like enzyme